MEISRLSSLNYNSAALSILGSGFDDQAAVDGLSDDGFLTGALSGNALSTFERLLETAQALKRSDGLSTVDTNPIRISSASDSTTQIDRSSPLYEQCRELETFLLKNLLSSMRKTVAKSGLLDTSFAAGLYEDMLYDEYAASLAKNGGFGLADQAYRELARNL